MPDKDLNSLVVQLNNGMVVKVALDNYERLDCGNQHQLDNWNLSGNGMGIHWEELDEDISIKSLIIDSASHPVLGQLPTKVPPSEWTLTCEVLACSRSSGSGRSSSLWSGVVVKRTGYTSWEVVPSQERKNYIFFLPLWYTF